MSAKQIKKVTILVRSIDSDGMVEWTVVVDSWKEADKVVSGCCGVNETKRVQLSDNLWSLEIR